MELRLPGVFILVIFFSRIPVCAQSRVDDSIFYRSAITNTIALYYSQLGDQSPIFNGSLYPPLPYTFREGSPFFLSEKSMLGSVVYDGVLYSDLSLKYEDFRQYLVSIDQAYQLLLINQKIGSFTIAGHHFENVHLDSLHRGISSAGFYEVLYAGPSRVLKRTYKKLNETLTVSEGVLRAMDVTEDYYIKNGNVFGTVNTKSELLTRMKNHRKEVQRYMSKNKLNFRKDKDNTLTLTSAYFDQLAD